MQIIETGGKSIMNTADKNINILNESKLGSIKDEENEEEIRASSIGPRKINFQRDTIKSTMSPRESKVTNSSNNGNQLTPLQPAVGRSKLSHLNSFSKTNMHFASS